MCIINLWCSLFISVLFDVSLGQQTAGAATSLRPLLAPGNKLIDTVYSKMLTSDVIEAANATTSVFVVHHNQNDMFLNETDSPNFQTSSSSSTVSEKGPKFSIGPHASYPTTVLQIKYERNNAYAKYQANYSDVSDMERQGASGSVFLTGENPFNIFNLNPGHLYSFEIYGLSSNRTALLYSNTSMTKPKAPLFNTEASIISKEDNISLMGDKPADALQDYFLLECTQLDPVKLFDPINVTDIMEQTKVELYVGNLNPGRNYNISVTAFKNGKPSDPWQKIITTRPERPVSRRITKLESNSLIMEWDPPTNGGVDRYHVTYQPVAPTVAVPGSTIDVNDVFETNVTLNEGLFPGDSYQFAVYSMKSNEASQPTIAEITMKPLPPVRISVSPDYAARKFLVSVQLPLNNLSRFDRCYFQYLSENSSDLNPLNETANIIPALNQCHFLIKLVPGLAYRFRAWTLSGDTPSSMYANRTVIRPAFDPDLFGLKAISVGSHTVVVSWYQDQMLGLYWPALVGSNSNLTAQLSGSTLDTPRLGMGSPLNTDASGGASSGITFHALPPGACFTVLAYTATPSGIVSINRSQTVVRTEPPMASVQTDTINQDSVNLTVQTHDASLKSGGNADDCAIHVFLLDESGHIVLNRTVYPLPRIDAQVLIPFRGLLPFARYHVRSRIECGGRVNGEMCPSTVRNASAFSFETAQGRPGPVQNLRSVPSSPHEVSVSWSEPVHPNGLVKSYKIFITPIDSKLTPWNLTQPSGDNRITISNMTGGNRYFIDVRALTKAGLGQSSNAGGIFDSNNNENMDNQGIQVQMPLWAPPRPTAPPEVLLATVRKTDFSVRFNLSTLSTLHGILEKYALIVIEGDNSRNENRSDILSWKDVQEFSIWPPYIAVEKSLQRSKVLDPVTVTEVIGVESDCSSNTVSRRNVRLSPRGTPVCNGPLRPSRVYRVKLRVYTAPDLFTDSAYSMKVKLEADEEAEVGTIIVVVVTVLACLCLCTLLAVFIRRNRGSDSSCVKMVTLPGDCLQKASDGASKLMPTFAQSHRRSTSLRERAGVEGRLEKLNPTQHRFNLPPVPTVVRGANYERNRPIRKCDFAEHVRLMSADSDFRFSEEYDDLKQVGRSQPCSAAELPCNRNKNRFTNVLPFDHSRVKLVPVDDEEGSDYVNANYIPGYNSPREFIAAQGPLPSTRDDFWRMIWEQQCPAVVNLTRCVEKGREKCDMYWPADGEQVLTYGDIEVTVLNETRFPDYNMREFRLTHMGEPGVAPRLVKHYHYFAWPDFGVPDRPQTLVRFVRYFRSKTPSQLAHRPSIIHCSAGVGRSGTLIALDRLLQSILREDTVDIYGMVYEMRKERVSMVQTEQQYICIHQCLLCVLDGRENDIGTPPPARIPLPPAAVYPRPVAPPMIAPIYRPPPRIEIHQNPAFEDDEGIAESGV